MGSWTLDDIPWDCFERSKLDPEICVRIASRRRRSSSITARPMPIISAGFSPTTRRSRKPRGAGARRRSSTEPRWRAGPGSPTPNSISSGRLPGFRPGSGWISTAPARAAARARGKWWRAASSRSAPAPIIPRCARRRRSRYCRKSAAISRPDELAPLPASFIRTSTAVWRREPIGRLARLASVALGRVAESEDDELAYAYYAANAGELTYDRRHYSRAYASRAFGLYRPHHVERGIAMLLKAVGLTPNGRLAVLLSRLAWRAIRYRAARLGKMAA